jgi:hypothetical protein
VPVSSTTAQTPEPEPVDVAEARRSLRNGFITLALAMALAVGLLVAVPGLSAVATTVSRVKPGWVAVAVGLEMLSCAGFVVAFLQVFERAPRRLGARVALSEMAFGSAVSIGGAGSLAVGAWLMVERGAPAPRVAERSAVLFLYTSAINVITLILAGLGLFLGLPGPQNPLLSIAPAAIGVLVLVLFVQLPRYVIRIPRRVGPGRKHAFLTGAAASVRDKARKQGGWTHRRLLSAPPRRRHETVATSRCESSPRVAPVPRCGAVLGVHAGGTRGGSGGSCRGGARVFSQAVDRRRS